MNIALSRVRKRLFFVADRNAFKEACTNPSWDSSWIAKDLLELSRNAEKEDPIFDGEYRLRSTVPSIYDLLKDWNISES